MSTMKLFLSILVYVAMMLSAAYAQDRLQLIDTIADEAGRLRHFELSVEESVRKVDDAKFLLKSALRTGENTDFQLAKTKIKSNKKSELYQQLYNNVPVYDAYY